MGRTNVDHSGKKPSALHNFFKALLATAFFRCWHILMLFTAWGTFVTIFNEKGLGGPNFQLAFSNTLLTVIGTVLGFVISYRTTTSFDRYNEGRRYWSTVILASRNIASAVWFHIPDIGPDAPWNAGMTLEERRARMLIEKKTVINLVEAFAVAVKHYLRGEEGINYADLYHLVKFLPSYALPAGMPVSSADQAQFTENLSQRSSGEDHDQLKELENDNENEKANNTMSDSVTTAVATAANSQRSRKSSADEHGGLPMPATSPTRKASRKRPSFLAPTTGYNSNQAGGPLSPRSPMGQAGEFQILPARNPPKYSYFDVFPFSLLVKLLVGKGKDLKGKKAARYRAKTRGQNGNIITHNVPLEINLYLTSYLASLNRRKIIDGTASGIINSSLNSLMDCLTGLERILTTPIPFSYMIHLYITTTIYCLSLPLQIWSSLHWLTIPATSIAVFIFFGFLVAAEEIENPFGYDKNDLNLDHFTQNIIRNELIAITSRPPPDPTEWAFSRYNDHLFATTSAEAAGTAPEAWVRRGSYQIHQALNVTKID